MSVRRTQTGIQTFVNRLLCYITIHTGSLIYTLHVCLGQVLNQTSPIAIEFVSLWTSLLLNRWLIVWNVINVTSFQDVFNQFISHKWAINPHLSAFESEFHRSTCSKVAKIKLISLTPFHPKTGGNDPWSGTYPIHKYCYSYSIYQRCLENLCLDLLQFHRSTIREKGWHTLTVSAA